MKTDYRALCAELLDEVAARPLLLDRELIARARAALAEPVGEGVTDEEAQQLFDSLRTPIYGRLTTDTQDRVVGHEPVRPGDFARAVLARYGHQPAPPAAVAPGLSMEDVAPLVAWLTEQAHQAADASQPTDAEMLTWAAQVIGERVDEDAPAPPAEGELVAMMKREADCAESSGHLVFMEPVDMADAADLLSQRQAAPPAAGEVGELVAWLRRQAEKWHAISREAGLTRSPMAERFTRAADLLEQLQDLAADAVSGLRYIEQTHGRLYGVGWGRVYEKADRLQAVHARAAACGEVGELVAWLRETGDLIQPSHLAEHQRYKRAADLLERQAAPVPVAERLPGPKDCDGKGRCWWGWTTYEGGADRWHWQIDFHDVDYVGGYCCWLPATALPLPAGEVQP